MTNDETEGNLERIQNRLSIFFPDEIFTVEALEEALDSGDVFFKSLDVLPYLQTALIDEKILEVEFDGLTRVYFSRLYDHPPPLEEQQDESGESVLVEPNYNLGDYLKNMTHIISLPVEPGIGNLFIRNSKKIIIRLFTTTYAVELGTFFQELTTVRDLPVLRLDFPVIGRIVRGAREFRAKVPENMKLQVLVMGKRKHGTIRSKITDISASGMAFTISKEQQELFRIDETRTMEILHDDLMMVRINGKVRHVSKLRGKKGTEFICGVQFDLATRAIAAKVESIVAQVQRAHLKEISDLSEESGLKLIV